VTAAPPGLDGGLAAVAGFLGPDGAGVVVLDWDDAAGELSLRLELSSQQCAECVVPRPLLDRLLLDTLREHAPSVRAVRLDDPREAS
jgi:hypothetical protein